MEFWAAWLAGCMPAACDLGPTSILRPHHSGLTPPLLSPHRTLSLSTALVLSPVGSGAWMTMVLRTILPSIILFAMRHDQSQARLSRWGFAMFLGAITGGCTMTLRARRMIDPSFRTARWRGQTYGRLSHRIRGRFHGYGFLITN